MVIYFADVIPVNLPYYNVRQVLGNGILHKYCTNGTDGTDGTNGTNAIIELFSPISPISPISPRIKSA